MMNLTRRKANQIARVSKPDPTPGFSPGAGDGRDASLSTETASANTKEIPLMIAQILKNTAATSPQYPPATTGFSNPLTAR
jgi:hypothetical protein